MSRGATSLSPEAELGLAGELAFVIALLDSEVPAEEVLKGWVGPDDAPQDFLLGDGAIEVKATMSSSGFPVKIGSLEQLDDSVASPLFLAAMRFSREERGPHFQKWSRISSVVLTENQERPFSSEKDSWFLDTTKVT